MRVTFKNMLLAYVGKIDGLIFYYNTSGAIGMIRQDYQWFCNPLFLPGGCKTD